MINGHKWFSLLYPFGGWASGSIQEFVSKNTLWIEKTRAKIKAVAPPPPKQYVTGEQFEYLGNAYPLEIVKDQKKSLLLEEGKFKLAAAVLDRSAAVFERWYKEQARQILSERVEFLAPEWISIQPHRHHFRPNALGVVQRKKTA